MNLLKLASFGVLVGLVTSCEPLSGNLKVFKSFKYLQEYASSSSVGSEYDYASGNWGDSTGTTEVKEKFVSEGEFEGKLDFISKKEIQLKFKAQGKSHSIPIKLIENAGTSFPEYSGEFKIPGTLIKQPFSIGGILKTNSWDTNEFQSYDSCLYSTRQVEVCRWERQKESESQKNERGDRRPGHGNDRDGRDDRPVYRCHWETQSIYGRQLVRHWTTYTQKDSEINLISAEEIVATFMGSRTDSNKNSQALESCHL